VCSLSQYIFKKEIRMRVAYLLITALLLCSAAGSVTNHPGLEIQPKPVRPGYDNGHFGYPPSWSYGDVVYERHPSAGSLSAAERYMLFGTEEGPDGVSIAPWWDTIYTLVKSFDKANGYVPTALTLAELRKIPGLEDLSADDDLVQTVKSPITGEFPVLNSRNFTPGSVFIRRLTKTEITELSKQDVGLRTLYFQKKFVYSTGENDNRPAKLTTPVYYVRVYGDDGVIETRLAYDFQFLDE
jgi:hypothetical protein